MKQMTIQLIKLQNKFILVSDEPIKKGDNVRLKSDYNVGQVVDDVSKAWSNWIKVYNPDFSLLSEEDCKTIGITHIDLINKLAYNEVTDIDNSQFDRGVIYGFHKGFKTAQSLNDKMFSLEDMREAMIDSFKRVGSLKQNLLYIDKYIQSLQQTSWEVEVNELNQIIKIL